MEYEVLFTFRPRGGADCKPFDAFILVNESMTIGDMIVEAQDYLYAQLTSGALRDSLPGGGGCDINSYTIDFGPTMGD